MEIFVHLVTGMVKGRDQGLARPCISGQCSLCGLRLPVSPFPVWTALPSQSTTGWSDPRKVIGFP